MNEKNEEKIKYYLENRKVMSKILIAIVKEFENKDAETVEANIEKIIINEETNTYEDPKKFDVKCYVHDSEGKYIEADFKIADSKKTGKFRMETAIAASGFQIEKFYAPVDFVKIENPIDKVYTIFLIGNEENNYIGRFNWEEKETGIKILSEAVNVILVNIKEESEEFKEKNSEIFNMLSLLFSNDQNKTEKLKAYTIK